MSVIGDMARDVVREAFIGVRLLLPYRQPQTIKGMPTVVHSAGWGGAYGEPPPAAVTAQPNLYALSAAVNVAVGENADRVASTVLELYRKTVDGEAERILTHDVLSLIDNPNPHMTRWELLWYTIGDLLLSGNAYWFLSGPQRGKPSGIWRMNPRRVRIVRSKQDYISGYVYEVDDADVPLHVDEVIHFRLPNPLEREFWGYGLPRLYAAALDAQSERDMKAWNRAWFTTGGAAEPAGIVNIEEFVDDATFERIKREWTQRHSGSNRKTAFIRGKAVSWVPTTASQKDYEFIAGLGWSATTIYEVFRCHHLKGGADATEGAIKANERLFIEGGLWPLMALVAEKITDALLPFWGGGLTMTFEDIRPRERALDLEEGREQAKGLTFNEWRGAHGLEPLPGWDDVLFVHVQQGIMPLDARLAITPPTPEPPPAPAPMQPSPGMDTDEVEQDAAENAEDRESRGEDVGDDIGNRFDKAWQVIDPLAAGRELAKWEAWASKRAEHLANLA